MNLNLNFLDLSFSYEFFIEQPNLFWLKDDIELIIRAN